MYQAKSINSITDLWSNKQLLPFLGLAVCLTFENMERECYVVGLKRIYGKHNSEIIKKLIEEIINEYQFDKSNIHGVVSDQGSNLHRLFKEAEVIKYSSSDKNKNSENDSEIDLENGSDLETNSDDIETDNENDSEEYNEEDDEEDNKEDKERDNNTKSLNKLVYQI